jgi:hypothetical protein
MISMIWKGNAMPDLETLRQQVPYELIPTNIPGVYTSPAPQESFDPETASSKVLRKHGLLWRRPTPSDDPALRQAWKEVFSHKWQLKDRFVPRLEPQFGKTHHLRKPLKKMTDGTYVDTTWAGAAISGGPWNAVCGYWNIPTLSQGPQPQGTMFLGWEVSSWIGIDGYGASNDVLQAGVSQQLLPGGITANTVWFEWYVPPPNPNSFAQYGLPLNAPTDGNGYPLAWTAPPGTPGFPNGGLYQYIYPTSVGNWMVQSGDQMRCSVQYIKNNSLGYIIIADVTKNLALAQPFTLVPPPNANANGSTVEWILECPNGGPPGTQLAQFTPVVFTTALACGIDNAGVLQTLTGPTNADTLNIGTDPNNPDNMNLTNVTLGPSTVTIDFV